MKYIDNVPDLMVSIYFELFAAMFLMVEFNIAGGRTKFYFLNSALGKGLFYFFLFFFCYANARNGAIWIDVFLSVIFFIFAVLMILIFCIFRHQEAAHITNMMHEIAANAPSKPKKEPEIE